jgi:predicted transcriptional regulator
VTTVKEDVRQILDSLPDDTTYEDVQYHLFVRQRIQRGLDELNSGRTVTQQEVEQRMRKWLDK